MTDKPATPELDKPGADFIRAIVTDDLRTQKHQRVVTRFPPEPNGYLHIGHAKSICLNFGVAQENGGDCHLRFDDTNPAKEDQEYVDAIRRDVRWLGFDWGEKEFFASDYFDRLYEVAVALIQAGKAYVDSLTDEEIREYRGTVTEPGRPSPYRDRSVAENLALFQRMKKGEFPDGAHVLRLKGDLGAANMKMRDPLIYRIRHKTHHHTGDKWCIYPFYDYAHCLSDSIEGITHSLCTLEFENNRELYDWILDESPVTYHPRQIEFARLNLTYTMMSKRKLLKLVQDKVVSGWDDPRMPTLAGIRRRGVTPEALRDFCDRIGVAKANSIVDVALLENSIREDLNQRCPRVLAVLRPLKVVIENFPEGESELLEGRYFPDDPARPESRQFPFTREIYIEQDDFSENPPPKYFRLAPGREVRLRYGYFIRCEKVIKDEAGNIVELRCTYDPATRGGAAPDGRKVQGTIHWVSATQGVPVTVRLYDQLFTAERPDQEEDLYAALNPKSLETLTAWVEPAIAHPPAESRYQFERLGYFYTDPVDSTEAQPIFNRITTLKDSWTKVAEPTQDLPKTRSPKEKGDKPKGEPKLVLDTKGEAYLATGMAPQEAKILAENGVLALLHDAAVAAGASPKTSANLVAHEIMRLAKGKTDLPFGGAELAELTQLLDAGTITHRIAKDLLAEMVVQGGWPHDLVKARGLEQVADDGALVAAVDAVLAANADSVERYRQGKTNLMGFFVGQVVKQSGGKANPKRVTELLAEKLKA